MDESTILALICAIASYLCVRYYAWTRKKKMPDFNTSFILRLGFCCLFVKFVLSSFSGMISIHAENAAELFIIFLIADVDILIGKIPCELLALLCVPIIKVVFMDAETVSIGKIILDVCFCVGVWLFSGKIGIGKFDILFFGLLALLTSDSLAFIRFTAASLCFWGIVGLILHLLTKEKARTIPLAPVFTFALFFENFVGNRLL